MEVDRGDDGPVVNAAKVHLGDERGHDGDVGGNLAFARIVCDGVWRPLDEQRELPHLDVSVVELFDEFVVSHLLHINVGVIILQANCKRGCLIRI